MNRIVPLIIILFFAFSCNRVESPKVQFSKWAQKGVIIDKVNCKSDATQSYCLYLPSYYDFNVTYPAIYAFDPHGNGRIPVELLKRIAEKLGYVVIGSNNSRNGISQSEINGIVNALFSDSQQKISIDPNRIYTLGFSVQGWQLWWPKVTGALKGLFRALQGFSPMESLSAFGLLALRELRI